MEKLHEMDDAFRKQLESVLAAHEAELVQLANEKQKQIEAANEKVILILDKCLFYLYFILLCTLREYLELYCHGVLCLRKVVHCVTVTNQYPTIIFACIDKECLLYQILHLTHPCLC